MKVGKDKSKWESVSGMGKVKEGKINWMWEKKKKLSNGSGKGEVGNWKWESESGKEMYVG